ncbi:MAG: BatD family protein [Bacteroidota bacterium]
MSSRRLMIRIILLFVLSPLLTFAQGTVSFEASADARQVVLSSYFEVTFTLKNAKTYNFSPPSFKDFKILGGPNQSTSVTSINGSWSQSISYSYTLQPKKIGKFTIGPATVTAAGKTLKSNPVSIEIVKGRNSNATTRDDIDKEMKAEIYIQAEANVTEAQIGEQVILDYKLYTTRDIETYKILFESDYSGFFAQDIRKFNARVVKEVINGVQFSTKVLKRVALFPQQAGALTIDPMVMQLAVIADSKQNRRGRGIFFTPNINRLQVETPALTININPLPSGAPPSFNGAVGRYQMQTQVNNQKNYTTDDAITLTMTITGSGDIKRVLPPKLQLSDQLELYEPRIVEEKTVENRGEITGRKIIEYLILPREPGRYTIRPEFSYYSSDSLSYITLGGQNYAFTVKQGSQKRTAAAAAPNRPQAESDIRHIKADTRLRQGKGGFFGSPLYYTLLGLPLLLFGGFIGYRQLQAGKEIVDPVLLKRHRARQLAQQRLAQADQYLQQQKPREFYNEVSQALFGYTCDKLNIPLAELSKQNVQQKLQSLQVDPPLIEQFMGILKTCEMALFAGKDNAAAMNETYHTAMDLVAKIEEQIGA